MTKATVQFQQQPFPKSSFPFIYILVSNLFHLYFANVLPPRIIILSEMIKYHLFSSRGAEGAGDAKWELVTEITQGYPRLFIFILLYSPADL